MSARPPGSAPLSRAEACERLALSRERLRQALKPPPPTPSDASGPDWQSLLKNVPGASALMDALRAWWSQSPLSDTVRLAAATAHSVLRPLAERHPLALVLGAAAAGAVLVISRPWRWMPRAALKSGLWAGLPGLLASALSRWPVQSWVDLVSQMIRQSHAEAAAAAPANAPAPAPPQSSPAPPPQNAPAG